MAALPNDRFELVLMADHPTPIHLWVKSTAELARRIDLNREKSIRYSAALALFLLLMLFFFRGATLLLLLVALMVLFPLWLVDLAGYSRGK